MDLAQKIFGCNHPGDERPEGSCYLWRGFPKESSLMSYLFQMAVFRAEGFIVLPIRGGW